MLLRIHHIRVIAKILLRIRLPSIADLLQANRQVLSPDQMFHDAHRSTTDPEAKWICTINLQEGLFHIDDLINPVFEGCKVLSESALPTHRSISSSFLRLHTQATPHWMWCVATPLPCWRYGWTWSRFWCIHVESFLHVLWQALWLTLQHPNTIRSNDWSLSVVSARLDCLTIDNPHYHIVEETSEPIFALALYDTFPWLLKTPRSISSCRLWYSCQFDTRLRAQDITFHQHFERTTVSRFPID
jgi:hypothetical protein